MEINLGRRLLWRLRGLRRELRRFSEVPVLSSFSVERHGGSLLLLPFPALRLPGGPPALHPVPFPFIVRIRVSVRISSWDLTSIWRRRLENFGDLDRIWFYLREWGWKIAPFLESQN